jgi:hypothetical protein
MKINNDECMCDDDAVLNDDVEYQHWPTLVHEPHERVDSEEQWHC